LCGANRRAVEALPPRGLRAPSVRAEVESYGGGPAREGVALIVQAPRPEPVCSNRRNSLPGPKLVGDRGFGQGGCGPWGALIYPSNRPGISDGGPTQAIQRAVLRSLGSRGTVGGQLSRLAHKNGVTLTTSRRTLGLLAALCLTAAPTLAQCPQPDRLDSGPCCAVAQIDLPVFPLMVQDSLNICWLDCDIDTMIGTTARWKAPLPLTGQPTSCGRFRSRLRLSDPAANKTWVGRVDMTYSRTWMETDISGVSMQVWRFLTNARLAPTPDAGTAPCPVPSCASSFPKVFFTGYIDYARDCGSGAWSIAWMLTHNCDQIHHAPGFARAGSFHPDRAYTFVGPAAGFAVGMIQPVAAGGSNLEAVRRLRIPPNPINDTECEFEEPIQASITPVQQLCLCGPTLALPQWVISDLFVGGVCGTSVVTAGGPYFPGYLSMGIGMWTDPGTYPGTETLRWGTGGYDYFDPCIGVVKQEVFYGVTTIGGNSATQILQTGLGLPLPLIFIDQSNSLRKSDGTTTKMNSPFVSDHVINLNF
jgi:hypothetical protein